MTPRPINPAAAVEGIARQSSQIVRRWSSVILRRCPVLWSRVSEVAAAASVAQSRTRGIKGGSAVARRGRTRAAEKLERRREAREQRQRAARQRRWRQRLLIGAGVTLVVGGVAALIVLLVVSSMPSAEVAARRVPDRR